MREVELDGVRHASVEWSARTDPRGGLRRAADGAPAFLDEPLWEHAALIVDTRNVVPDGPNVAPALVLVPGS